MPEKNNEVTTTEIMEFLTEHMVMKEDFEERAGGLENKVDSIENRLIAIRQELVDIRRCLSIAAIPNSLKRK